VTTRFVGAYAATRDWGRLHGLLTIVQTRVFRRTVAAAVLGALVLLLLRNSTYDHSIPAALVALPLFVLTAQLLLRGAALQGFKRVVSAQLPNAILRPAIFLAVVWVAMIAGFTVGAANAVAFNVGATLIALLLAERYLREATPIGVRETSSVSEWKEWQRAGYSLIFITAAQLLLSDGMGVLLVAFLLGRVDSAYYSIASQLALFVAFATTAMMFIVAPLISELYATGQLDTLRRFARATTTVCIAAALTLLLGIATFGRPLLGIFGEEYKLGYYAMVVLATSHFVSASVGALAGWLMTMTGHERAAAWMIGGSGLLQIALAIPLTELYGTVGTATATLLAVLTRSLMLSIFLRRRLGILLMPGFGRALRA
jgi:O-antigen/teichoic acid export membrane protein